MFSVKSYVNQLNRLLEQLDGISEDLDDEDLEDLNAEFEDAIFMFSELDPKDDGFQEDLDDALETLSALAGDYGRWPECSEAVTALKALVEALRTESGE